MKPRIILLSLCMALIAQPLIAQQPEKPLNKQQILELLAGGVTSLRATELVKQRGVDFLADDDYLQAVRKAGGSKSLIAAVQEASSAATSELIVDTSPGADIQLDGAHQGRADAQGQLTLMAKLGPHNLEVFLAGKKNFTVSVTMAGGEPTRIVAQLMDAPGSLRVQTSAGADVALDNTSRGSADSSGQILLPDVSPGQHALRVSTKGKVDELRTITVTPGVETQVEVVLRDRLRVNPKDGLEYAWIPAGTFVMGCSPGDSECADPEKPAHQVTLSQAFWIGQTEVSVGAYKRFVDAAKAKMPPVSPRQDKGWKDDNMPIVDVTWDEARQYCVWAGGRLPSEAEWEYAARGGSSAARYGDLNAIAWFKDNSGRQTHEVGAKAPNGFGLIDTLGNVWEWVNDWYDPAYYPHSPSQDPPGPDQGQERVLRGGSWIEDPRLLRASDRYSNRPNVRSDFFGFRCARGTDDP